MEKFKYLQKIKEIYAQGGNIINYLKTLGQNQLNSIEDILISYDFQSGSYIKSFATNPTHKNEYCAALAKIIDGLDQANSIIEVGVGEATTLSTLLSKLNHKPADVLGFDISWSRIKFAQEFLKDFGFDHCRLFTANLFEIPLLNNSVDIVYTSHSIEPNGGQDENALKELYRITNKYLILLEPSYEFAHEEARKRMVEHGYVTKLHQTAIDLNYKIIEHRLFDFSANPLNPTGIMIIEKEGGQKNKAELVCPITFTNLEKLNAGLLYSNDCFLAYPVIENIPCLLKENSILASHLKTNFEAYKTKFDIDYSVKEYETQ
ncbi:MAG: class I SAM-dependent methyltransferase [Saprospiraceae bacterium]